MKKLSFWLTLLWCMPVVSFALSTTEQTMVNQIQQSQKAQQQFLEKIVNIQSGTMNTKGVHAVGKVVQKELEQLGFKTKWVEEPAKMHRAGTLVATHQGTKGKRLLLIAHFDTVFAKSLPFKKYQVTKNTAKGQGVIDDKGGIAVMLYALKAMQKAGTLKNANITIIITGDEEESGKPASISRKPLFEAAKKADIALDFEPAINSGTATIARRGITNWSLNVSGNASHSATIFQKQVGIGAIFAASQQLNEMRKQMQSIYNLTFNPGIIMGGSSINYNTEKGGGDVVGRENIVASKVLVKGDLRYIDQEQKKHAEDVMQKIVNTPLPGAKATLSFVDGIPPMSPTQHNLKLLNDYNKVSIDLGQGTVAPLDAGVRGAADISYISSMVPANLSGLGPVGIGAHTNIEAIELPSLLTQTQRAALFMSRLVS